MERSHTTGGLKLSTSSTLRGGPRDKIFSRGKKKGGSCGGLKHPSFWENLGNRGEKVFPGYHKGIFPRVYLGGNIQQGGELFCSFSRKRNPIATNLHTYGSVGKKPPGGGPPSGGIKGPRGVPPLLFLQNPHRIIVSTRGKKKVWRTPPGRFIQTLIID